MAASSTTTNTTAAPGGMTSTAQHDDGEYNNYVVTSVVPPNLVRQIQRDVQRDALAGTVYWVRLIAFYSTVVQDGDSVQMTNNLKVIFNGVQIELKLSDDRGVPLPLMTTIETQTELTGAVMAVGTCVDIASSPLVPVATVDDAMISDESMFNTAMDNLASWQPNISGPLDTGVLEEPQTEETVATENDEAPTDLTKTVMAPVLIDLSENEETVVTAPCEPVNIGV